MLAVSYRCTFHDYLLCARHRVGLLQIARERRNLLPLLALINPAKWERSDLFSRKLWVLSGRKTTILQRYPLRPRPDTPLPWVSLRGSCAHFRGGYSCITPFMRRASFAKVDVFTHAAAWRWLSRAPVRVVRAWVEYGGNAAIIAAKLLSCREYQYGQVKAGMFSHPGLPPLLSWNRHQSHHLGYLIHRCYLRLYSFLVLLRTNP